MQFKVVGAFDLKRPVLDAAQLLTHTYQKVSMGK
jgi:hypothetical protein